MSREYRLDDLCGEVDYRPSFGQGLRPPEFSPPKAVRRAHDRPLRFGFIKNITAVVESNDPDEAEDYLKGIMVAAIIMFVIYVVWLVVLWVLKCFRHRTGIFSGTPITLPGVELAKGSVKESVDNVSEPPVAPNEESNGTAVNLKDPVEIAEARASAYQCMQWMRYICLFSLYGVMVGCCLMATKGINNVEEAANTSQLGFSEGIRLATDAAALIERYAEHQKPLLAQMALVRRDFNGFCPKVRQDICEVNPTTFQLSETCNYDDIPFGELLAKIDLPRINTAVFFEDLEDAQIDLLELAADLQEYEEDIEDVEWPFRVARGFALVLLFLCTFLLICLACAWRNDHLKVHSKWKVASKSVGRQAFYGYLKSWVLLPLFVLFVVLALVFSTVFVMISTTTSDVCADSPDATILAFLENNEDSISSLTYRFMTYYVDRCSPDRAPLDFDEQLKAILDVFDVVGQFLEAIRDSADAVAAVCGPSPNPVVVSGELLLEQICLVRNTIISVALFFSCQNWHPLYSVVAHEALCNEGAYGFRWLAISQLTVVLFALILLTVRAGLYEMPDPGIEGSNQPVVEASEEEVVVESARAAAPMPGSEETQNVAAVAEDATTD